VLTALDRRRKIVTVRRVLTAIGVAALTLGSAALAGGSSLSLSSADQACARGYKPCLPVRADLDCRQIPDANKPVRVTGADPYRLDADRDGLGCEVSGEGGGTRSPWGLILRKPPRQEAMSARAGDLLTVVGWSPAAFRGVAYQLCQKRLTGLVCIPGVMPKQPLGFVLRGRVQVFATWRVTRLSGVGGLLTIWLQVRGKLRASDSVPVR